MQLNALPVSLISLIALSLTSSAASYSNASHPPLFPPLSTTAPPLTTYHTSLSTLLPILPQLAPPPTHTLLVTLATSAFKPLLYNYLCFLRYRAQWGSTPLTHPHAKTDDGSDPSNDPYSYSRRRQIHEDLFKILVVTSDPTLASELSDHGVVVWYLDAIDWESPEADQYLDGTLEDDELRTKFDRLLQDDLFGGVRMMDLLLSPKRHDHEAATRASEVMGEMAGKMLEWGSLHYQSLMLERTLIMSTLVGALVESQKVDPEWRVEQEVAWKKRWDEHDWDHEPPLVPPPFEGVKGVLLADNDAVWLSSPESFFAHSYRPQGSHPSFIVASDIDPNEHPNAYGLTYTPCACFIYTRTSDIDAPTASPNPRPDEPEHYSPATGAATAWRFTTMCHLAMLLHSIEDSVEYDRGAEAEGVDTLKMPRLAALRRAIAPSFQATSLGPALYLAEEEDPPLPVLTHDEWLDVISSFDTSALVSLLEEAGLGVDEVGPSATTRGAPARKTCEDLAIRSSKRRQCPNPVRPLDRTSLTSPARPGRAFHRGIKTEVLPYDLFPPGIRYFDGGLANGERPCVVHANYAVGKTKEELLRKSGLWALWQDDEGEWRCDAEVMSRAK